ncbi:hypothetical protein BN946_scf184967.g4 [Trametes cinnabarina]|uniref:Hyaluronan/mRNA-binding protein domain-containing protein n=1 Tax=Pycnoporus cinnabarinus TaxID=5643 RepID=A0A060SM38_PYCCI|nr:hypothetical protein BN946_scf184967.g4 [Trametes cinnabarina]
MSVASRNPFALLDEDASRPASPSPATPAKEAAPAPAPTRGTQKSRGGPASRGGRYYQRGGKSAPRDKENGEAAAEDSEPKKRDGEGRGRGRGRGRGDRARGRGRQFDRHSATGKTDSEKKVHQGWGGDEPTSELNAETGAATDAAAEKNEWTNSGEGDAWAAAAADTGDAAASGEKAEGRKPREPREPEEEDNTLTLDEYLKKKQSLDIVPKPEVRKVDDSDLKDAVIITKKDEDEDAYFVGKTKSSAPKPKPKKEDKIYIEIDARFERPSRGGRGRGDRGGDRPPRGGGGRGRGGRGRAANGNNSAPALNVADEAAFPSLA